MSPKNQSRFTKNYQLTRFCLTPRFSPIVIEAGEIYWIDNLGIILVTFLTEMIPQLCMQYVCLSRYLSWLLVMDR